MVGGSWRMVLRCLKEGMIGYRRLWKCKKIYIALSGRCALSNFMVARFFCNGFCDDE